MESHTDQIVQVGLQADAGGDGRVATNLHLRYLERGYISWLLVGRGRLLHPNMSLLRNDDHRNLWARKWLSLASTGHRSKGNERPKVKRALEWMAEPRRRLGIRRGFEDFDFPATYPMIGEILSVRRSILHCHNLHGDYFDLRALPRLNRISPVVLTLHDAWTMSGHCGHSFDCQRWLTGCGRCPDLTIYPGIPRDSTATNWQRKREIFSRSKLHVVTPCRWLRDKAERSLIMPSIQRMEVIPNGVDLKVFHPGDRREARARLKIPNDKRVILMVADQKRLAQWMDLETIDQALQDVSREMAGEAILVHVGSEGIEPLTREGLSVVGRPHTSDPDELADHYRAADVYIHPAREDTFPNAILEALACGVPVIATAVGGIPEQIKGLQLGREGAGGRYPQSSATGVLTPPADREGFGRALTALLGDRQVTEMLGSNAAKDASTRFDLDVQVSAYLDLYRAILKHSNGMAARRGQNVQDRR